MDKHLGCSRVLGKSLPLVCTSAGAKQPEQTLHSILSRSTQVKAIYLEALARQPCLQWLQFHADIFDRAGLMEKNDFIPQTRQTLVGVGVGSGETFIYMSHFYNSEEFKHPFGIAFHFLSTPLMKINERTRIY